MGEWMKNRIKSNVKFSEEALQKLKQCGFDPETYCDYWSFPEKDNEFFLLKDGIHYRCIMVDGIVRDIDPTLRVNE